MVQSDTVIWIQHVSWLHDQFCPIPKVVYWIEIAIWVVWTDCRVQEIIHPAGRSHQKKHVTLKQQSVPTGHCSRTHEQMNMPRTYRPHQNTTSSSLNDWQDCIDQYYCVVHAKFWLNYLNVAIMCWNSIIIHSSIQKLAICSFYCMYSKAILYCHTL